MPIKISSHFDAGAIDVVSAAHPGPMRHQDRAVPGMTVAG